MATKDITAEDKLIIDAQDKSILAKWACMINAWEWPAELPGHDGGTYLYRSKKFKVFGIVLWRSKITDTRECQVREYIVSKVGHKAVHAEWKRRYATNGHFFS